MCIATNDCRSFLCAVPRQTSKNCAFPKGRCEADRILIISDYIGRFRDFDNPPYKQKVGIPNIGLIQIDI